MGRRGVDASTHAGCGALRWGELVGTNINVHLYLFFLLFPVVVVRAVGRLGWLVGGRWLCLIGGVGRDVLGSVRPGRACLLVGLLAEAVEQVGDA